MRRVPARIMLLLCSLLSIFLFVPSSVKACNYNLQSCTSSWGVSETYFGNGGSLDTTCSTGSVGYCAKQSVGELGVGNTSSGALYQAHAGFNENREPSLTLLANDPSCSDYQSGGASQSLGNLSTGSTKTANNNFSVKTYLASGYIVQTIGAAPTSNGPSPYTMTALSSGGASSFGTEQFGINLVANTSPSSFGHNVQQLPDSTFSLGGPAAGYDTTNSYKYNNGDTIASASKSSGTTCYSMSYIFNISNLTPAGTYTMNQAIVATSTY